MHGPALRAKTWLYDNINLIVATSVAISIDEPAIFAGGN
jgi:hypothetical protein